MKLLLTAGLLLMSGTAIAQVELASSDDFSSAQLSYVEGQIAQIRTVPDHQLTLSLPNGESVQAVTVDDMETWHVTVAASQDSLGIVAHRAVSNGVLKVRTEKHDYEFALSAAYGAPAPQRIRLTHDTQANAAGTPQSSTAPVNHEPGSYKLSGAKALLPTAIRDDGAKTYIQWSDEQAIPAIFSLDRGHEELINGYMRDGMFTLDRTYDRLLFRIDKAEASARRSVQRLRK
jgi:type IV secretion system protein VirB9